MVSRCSIKITHAIRDLVQEGLAENCVRSEATLVKVLVAVGATVDTVGFIPSQAVTAVAAAIVLVAEAHTVADLEVSAVRADSFNDTNAFVAKNDVFVYLFRPVSLNQGRKGMILT
ncbi:hypothetical protein RRF57_008597 [Xylaria bambusicola]|uniref:Uncharacterized protein n=1 Tax=Xylaria bambusicola TaxID=326684 RepID=A0AAN7UTQ7_9PEZI